MKPLRTTISRKQSTIVHEFVLYLGHERADPEPRTFLIQRPLPLVFVAKMAGVQHRELFRKGGPMVILFSRARHHAVIVVTVHILALGIQH